MENNVSQKLIVGNNNIYYTAPAYGHQDYNKSRIFTKNEKTLKLMDIFNNALKINL
jgi:hypothetical protein